MKIAILVAGGVDRSGVERVVPCLLWLIERLVHGGDEVHVFVFRTEPQPGTWQLCGATVHNAGASIRRRGCSRRSSRSTGAHHSMSSTRVRWLPI